VGLDRETGESVSEIEGEVHKRTSVSSIKLRFKKMRLEVNALNYIMKRVLSMEYENRK